MRLASQRSAPTHFLLFHSFTLILPLFAFLFLCRVPHTPVLRVALGFAFSYFVIPTGAARFSLPRRSEARRAAQWRDLLFLLFRSNASPVFSSLGFILSVASVFLSL